MPLIKALELVQGLRPQTAITKPYLQILETWSKRYTLGMTLCLDCVNVKMDGEKAKDVTTPKEDNSVQDLIMTIKALINNSAQQSNSSKKGNATDLTRLGSIESCFIPISKSIFKTPLSRLMDLNLSNQHLNDTTLAVLFQLMGQNQLLTCIRTLDLKHNQISSVSMKALLLSLYPRVNYDPDDDNYIEDELEDDELATTELRSLDLSHNK